MTQDETARRRASPVLSPARSIPVTAVVPTGNVRLVAGGTSGGRGFASAERQKRGILVGLKGLNYVVPRTVKLGDLPS